MAGGSVPRQEVAMMRAFILRLSLIVLALVLTLGVNLRNRDEAAALFHLAVINEILSGFDGDPNVQYVEIEQLTINQNFVTNTRLSAFDAAGNFVGVLLLVPNDVANSGDGVPWLMATQAFADLTGLQPDFIFPPGILAPDGMVCWGAPGASAPDPATWDPAIPTNYTDCVSYGNFTGTNPFSTTSAPIGPGDCGRSLQRVAHTGDNAADFILAPPSPTRNDGQAVTSPA
jgi:hypothetical protein